MIFTRVKNNLTNPAYYFSQILGIISISFLTIVWLYLAKSGFIKQNNFQIISYYFSIYAFYYLFTYSLIDRIAVRFQSPETFLLLPGSIYKKLFIKEFLPLICDNLPLIVISLILFLFINNFSPIQLIIFILLQLIIHLIYFFISIIGAILQILLNWSYISFSFRFIGQTWNGSYVPLIFLSGKLLSFALFLPIFYSGIPFQLFLVSVFDYRYFLNILIYIPIIFFCSFFMLFRFKQYVQQ